LLGQFLSLGNDCLLHVVSNALLTSIV